MISFTSNAVDLFLSEGETEPVVMLNLLRALVRYPTRRAFANMIADPDYQSADHICMSALAQAVLQPIRELPI